MHLVAAVDHYPEIRPVLGLFEGVVTGAADGYARMSGKSAANLLHLGPGLGNAFANIAVSGQDTVEADTTTDTLTIVGTGLNSISTDASTDTLTIGTSRGINFTKRDGTATFIDPSSNATTLGTTINTLFVPFTLRDGTDKTTLLLQ